MNDYRFKLKKIVTNTVEVKAENYREALVKLLEFMEVADKEIFENSEEKNIDYDIILEKTKSQNDIKSIAKVKEILEKIKDDEEKCTEEFICNKCKECLKLDNDFMS